MTGMRITPGDPRIATTQDLSCDGHDGRRLVRQRDYPVFRFAISDTRLGWFTTIDTRLP